MSIFKVDTFELAQKLRGEQINRKGGALILDASKGGEPKHLLEKLIEGEKYLGKPYDKTPWKGVVRGVDEATGKDVAVWSVKPEVYVVGEASLPLVDEIEKLVPGFVEKFGPVQPYVAP